jgi:hypothetical protein
MGSRRSIGSPARQNPSIATRFAACTVVSERSPCVAIGDNDTRVAISRVKSLTMSLLGLTLTTSCRAISRYTGPAANVVGMAAGDPELTWPVRFCEDLCQNVLDAREICRRRVQTLQPCRREQHDTADLMGFESVTLKQLSQHKVIDDALFGRAR